MAGLNLNSLLNTASNFAKVATKPESENSAADLDLSGVKTEAKPAAKNPNLIAIGNTQIDPRKSKLLSGLARAARSQGTSKDHICIKYLAQALDTNGVGSVLKASAPGENNGFQAASELLASGKYVSIGSKGQSKTFSNKHTRNKPVTYKLATSKDVINAPAGAIILKTQQPGGFAGNPKNTLPGRSSPSSGTDGAVKVDGPGSDRVKNFAFMPASSIYGPNAETIILVPVDSVEQGIPGPDDTQNIASKPAEEGKAQTAGKPANPSATPGADQSALLAKARIDGLLQGIRDKQSQIASKPADSQKLNVNLDKPVWSEETAIDPE